MEPYRYLVAGPIWLDCRDERLWLDGKPVRLGGKAVALLRALMEQPLTLVSKNALLETVWPGVAVTESVLTTAMKEIRQALGDDARRPRLVQTVHGRGYRFLAEVERADEPPIAVAGRARRRRIFADVRLWAALAGLALALVVGLLLMRPGAPSQAENDGFAPHPKSIAVLPFEDLSPERDHQWFAAGLTEEILNSLARTPDLRVAARTSTRAIPPGDMRRIGRGLNVAHLLEGSVRRDAGRVRVTAQLIRVSDGFHLWSQNYDRAADDVVTIQEEIAVAIAHALQTVMSPEQLQRMVSLGTRSVEAYEAYLRGMAYERRGLETGSDEDARLASESYERARSLDPGFAAAQWEAAWDWYGNTTRVGAHITESRGGEAARLREYLLRVDAAIAASAGRPEQNMYRSARAVVEVRLREALRLMRLYLRERPRDIDAWGELVDLAGHVGDRRLMAQAAERIHALSIESGSPRSRAITASVLAMDIDNAVARARRQLAMRPGEALIQYQAHRALLWGGHRDEARIVLARLRAGGLPEENKLLAALRQACAEGGHGARSIVERLDRLPDVSLSGRWHAAMLIGDRARAVDMLRSLDRPERHSVLIQYLVYPEFDVRPFPLLRARLEADGIRRPPPVTLPFACRPESVTG